MDKFDISLKPGDDFLLDGKRYCMEKEVKLLGAGEDYMLAQDTNTLESVLLGPGQLIKLTRVTGRPNEIVVSTPVGLLKAELCADGSNGIDVTITKNGCTQSVCHIAPNPSAVVPSVQVTKGGSGRLIGVCECIDSAPDTDALRKRVSSFCSKRNPISNCSGLEPTCPFSAAHHGRPICCMGCFEEHYDYIDYVLKQHGF